jgi:hypothetical protein
VPQSATRSMPSHPTNAPAISEIQAIELNGFTMAFPIWRLVMGTFSFRAFLTDFFAISD